MYGRGNMETYITIYKIDSEWEFAVWLTKLKQGICIQLEGWDGEGGGREVQKGGEKKGWIFLKRFYGTKVRKRDNSLCGKQFGNFFLFNLFFFIEG